MYFPNHRNAPRAGRRSFRATRLIWLVRSLPVPIMLLSGCAHTPVREAVAYTDAFQNVALVTEELLGDYAVAVDTIEKENAADANLQPSYPIQFDPGAALSAKSPDPAVVSFQNSLRAVDAYNGVLLDLARGQSDAGLQRNAATVERILESFGIGAAPMADVVQNLFTLIAQAHNRKQFADTLRKGRPMVDAILQNLVDATPDFYRVRVGLVGAAVTDIEFKQETTLEELDRIAQEYASPASGTELALRRAQVETEVAVLRAAISPDSAGRPLYTGARTYDIGAQERLEAQARVLRGLCEDRRAMADGLTDYHAQLADYVRLLDDTRRYFDALLAAIDTSKNSDAALRAHNLSSDAADLRNDMRETHSALALPARATP